MKVLFFIEKSAGNFIDLIDYLETYFPDYEKKYIVIDRHQEYDFSMLHNAVQITSYMQFVFDKDVRSIYYEADKVIVSGVFVSQYVLLFFPRKILKKTYYQFWGGDYTRFRKKTIQNYLSKCLINRCIKHSKGIITLVESEREEFALYFNIDKPFFSVPVTSGPKDQELRMKCRQKAKENDKKNRIIIGNSSSQTNNHFEIFEMMSAKNWKDYEIYCPLSYGDMEYAKKVIEKGKSVFGKSFIPLEKKLEYKEYLELLSTCSVGIYNHDRQQGLGNISLLISFGKKVYVRKNSENWKHYSKYGMLLNDIEEIRNQTIDEIFAWDDSLRIKNMRAYENRGLAMKEEWKRILDD
nr:TDP-N-acetylfucosamine:lipid II N-acetylfucosaminyltransferase [uncultured Acetatifactor sp.]